MKKGKINVWHDDGMKSSREGGSCRNKKKYEDAGLPSRIVEVSIQVWLDVTIRELPKLVHAGCSGWWLQQVPLLPIDAICGACIVAQPLSCQLPRRHCQSSPIISEGVRA